MIRPSAYVLALDVIMPAMDIIYDFGDSIRLYLGFFIIAVIILIILFIKMNRKK